MKTLVMIPAFGCDARLYAPQEASLAGRVQTQVVTTAADRIEGMVAQVLAVAPKEFVILGTSMGGRVALETALAAPERVKGLVVIGSGAGPTADPAGGQRRADRIANGEQGQVVEELAALVAHLPGPRGEATRQAFLAMGQTFVQGKFEQQALALAYRSDRWSDVATIACPVLCLWGADDKLSPPADGKRLADSVKRGRYVELPACGHFPSLEYPDETTAALAGWLADSGLMGA